MALCYNSVRTRRSARASPKTETKPGRPGISKILLANTGFVNHLLEVFSNFPHSSFFGPDPPSEPPVWKGSVAMPLSAPFYVIGHPLGHSMSPFIHTRLFAAQGREESYTARDIPPETLDTALPALLKETGGINVTIPYKQAVIPFLDGLCGRAELYRSVNTIGVTDKGIFGHNTDAEGFLAALEGGGVRLAGRVALLGCGGVGRTFACEAALAGCTVVNAVRESDLPQGEELQRYVRQLVPAAETALTTLDRLEGDFDLLINATPVGMYPHAGAMPVEKPVLSRVAAVFDAVYNPGETALLECTRANGAKTVGGMPMLVWQAAIAHRIWYQAEFAPDAIAALIGDAQREMARRFG